MKIAVKLNEDKSVQFVNNTSEEAALNQSKDKGWTLVDSDPAFLLSERYSWTVRQSDNKLVHTATLLTPDEEFQKSSTETTDLLLKYGMDIEQIKQSITELTNEQLNSKTNTSTTN